MKLFKSPAEKEAERRTEFAELLQSHGARRILFERFGELLQSDWARQMLFKLLAGARLQEELEAAIAAVKRQLIDYLDVEVQQLHGQIDAEVADWREEIPRRAADIRRGLKKSLAEHELEIAELTRVSAVKAIEEVLNAYLHNMLREEVRAFIRVHPVCSGLSNRQLAAANGLSIREVKRRRRRGYF